MLLLLLPLPTGPEPFVLPLAESVGRPSRNTRNAEKRDPKGGHEKTHKIRIQRASI
jgi:hypothetical protein